MVSYAILFTIVMSLLIRGLEIFFSTENIPVEEKVEVAETEMVNEY